METAYLKKIIESVLLVSDKPVHYAQLHEVFPEITQSLWNEAIQLLRVEYHQPGKGIQLTEVAGGFQLCTAPECAEFLKRLYKTRRVVRLSGPALETLAIIAYKQPVTRAEIEFVRGVNVDGVIKTLEERNLIVERGRKEVPGRPLLYVTTTEFLHYFGLKSLADLPALETYQTMEGMDGAPLPAEYRDDVAAQGGQEIAAEPNAASTCAPDDSLPELSLPEQGKDHEHEKTENITSEN